MLIVNDLSGSGYIIFLSYHKLKRDPGQNPQVFGFGWISPCPVLLSRARRRTLTTFGIKDSLWIARGKNHGDLTGAGLLLKKGEEKDVDQENGG